MPCWSSKWLKDLKIFAIQQLLATKHGLDYKAECCCTENATDCDDRQNWILFEGYDDFAEKCPGKCQECECTESSISARIDGGVKVKTWTPEDEFHANGAPNLGFNI